MDLSTLPSSFFVAVTVASFTTILTLYRFRDHAFTGLLLWLADFGLVILLPFVLISTISVGIAEAERLFLSSTTFYVAILVCQILFPDISQRLSHPITTLYLFFAVLLLSASLEGSIELGSVIFAYKLGDNITLAAVVYLFISAIVLPSKQVSIKVNDLVNLRHLENARTEFRSSIAHKQDTPEYKEAKTVRHDSQDNTLGHCLKLLRRSEYESCLECCDMGIERFIESKFLLFCPNGLSTPLTIEEQLSKLSSKGLSLDEESIIRLRRLRNTITISSGQATYHQAKWAIHVLRATIKPGSKPIKSRIVD